MKLMKKVCQWKQKQRTSESAIDKGGTWSRTNRRRKYSTAHALIISSQWNNFPLKDILNI